MCIPVLALLMVFWDNINIHLSPPLPHMMMMILPSLCWSSSYIMFWFTPSRMSWAHLWPGSASGVGGSWRRTRGNLRSSHQVAIITTIITTITIRIIIVDNTTIVIFSTIITIVILFAESPISMTRLQVKYEKQICSRILWILSFDLCATWIFKLECVESVLESRN